MLNHNNKGVIVAFEVIILAAGQGTRMRSKLPKVLHCVAGKPMLAHVIDTSRQLGAQAIHVVVGHGAEKVQQCIADKELHWALQEQQLGTGHAVAQAMPAVNDDSVVLIAYGDVPLVTVDTLSTLIDSADQSTLSLLTVSLEDPTGYGRIVRDDDAICAIVEQKDATPDQLSICEVNTGILAVPASKLKKWLPELSSNNAQGEYYLTDIISMAVKDGMRVVAQHPSSQWEVHGVNSRQQLSDLERFYQLQQAQRLMAEGATLADPNRVDVRGKLTIGQDIFIDINCVFIGDVNIGDDVHIGPNCVIENAVIGSGSVINPNSTIENAELADNCEVGPFARLRPGTVMASNSKVGNFVELKKTHLGEGSKANHLAYIGDSQIGKGCNIGAGTITCNYDGVNKFKTTMGDNVFVGSNSTLVAPLEIADGGFVGAGSTVTKNVPESSLAVARARQRNVDGWKRPSKDK